MKYLLVLVLGFTVFSAQAADQSVECVMTNLDGELRQKNGFGCENGFCSIKGLKFRVGNQHDPALTAKFSCLDGTSGDLIAGTDFGDYTPVDYQVGHYDGDGYTRIQIEAASDPGSVNPGPLRMRVALTSTEIPMDVLDTVLVDEVGVGEDRENATIEFAGCKVTVIGLGSEDRASVKTVCSKDSKFDGKQMGNMMFEGRLSSVMPQLNGPHRIVATFTRTEKLGLLRVRLQLVKLHNW